MKIKQITLHHIQLTLKTPFSTSYGTVAERDFMIVEMEDADGRIGWGEGVAFSIPWYTEETTKTTWHIMEDFLIPSLFKATINHPSEVSKLFGFVKRNHMAKAALEEAVWDLYAKQQGISLSQAIGGIRKSIDVGVAIGITSGPELLKAIAAYLEDGYKRIKVKIKPGQDYSVLKEIRNHFPKLAIMADANSAYSLADLEDLKRLDELELMMIEQPLASDDIVDHAKLQAELSTPICLDESIVSYDDARKAIELGSCQVINIKMGRVGGITEAMKIHDLCKAKGVDVWCGGMLETGIGRAHNIALSSLSHFTLPGDLSASSRYWHEDIIEPEVTVNNGVVQVPSSIGIGFQVNRTRLKKYSLCSKKYRNKR